RPPLLARHSPAVAGAYNIFHLALMTYREFDSSVDVPLAGALNAVFVEVGVLVVINIDELETPKIHAVRTRRPDSIEKIRIKDFQRERHPPARGSAIEHTRVWFADRMKILFDIRNEFVRHGIAVRSAVVGIHLV